MVTHDRAAIYARFSSDMQQDRSIEDQIKICENLAKRDGIKVVATFEDRAKSGASMFERDGLFALMKAATAKQKEFNMVIVESLDRLSRDQEDLAGLFKKLTFNEVDIQTVNEGKATPIHVGIRGLVGSLFLTDLGNKTRRGQNGRAREGKIPGSVPLGYRYVAGKKGEPEIDPAQAKIVNRIFDEYVSGRSPREIAQGLTRDGIPAPRGASWNYQNFISGRCGRPGGLLSNPIYVGTLVWNTTKQIINPDTGKKVKRATPPQEHITTSVPHLRIIDQSLWDAAQSLREGRARSWFGPTGKIERKRPFLTRSKHLLTGLLRCGLCGSNMRIRSVTRGIPYAACTTADAHGACDHRRTYNMNEVLSVVWDGLPKIDFEAMLALNRGYKAEQEKRNKKTRSEVERVRKDCQRVEIEIDRLVAAIESSDLPIAVLTQRLAIKERERVGLADRLRLVEAEDNKVVDLLPSAHKSYLSGIKSLAEAFERDPNDPTVRIGFHNYVHSIAVYPAAGRGFEVAPFTRLSVLTGGTKPVPPARSVEKICAEQGVTLLSGGKTLNSALPGNNKLVPLGRWRKAA